MSVRYERYLLAMAAAALLPFAGCNKPAPTPQPENAAQPAAAVTQIGGEDIVHLQRKATSNGAKPEFLSATIFPGRGMNLFQITANIPGKGEVKVLASPSIEDAAAKLNGGPQDQTETRGFLSAAHFSCPIPTGFAASFPTMAKPSRRNGMASPSRCPQILPVKNQGQKSTPYTALF